MTVAVRAADPVKDAAPCAAVYAPYVIDHWASFELEAPDAAEMARRMVACGQSHGWLVAERERRVIGYAYGCPHRERAAYARSCDTAVYIDAAFTGRGIGRALYTELLAGLRQRGFHAAFAGVVFPNPASIALHEAMGFTPVGIYRQVGWKHDEWRDVGWWQLLL